MKETRTHIGANRYPQLVTLVRLIVLLCSSVACLAQQPARNPYDSAFTSLISGFKGSSAPRQAVLIARAYKLREFVNSPSAVTTWLTTIIAAPEVSQLVRDEATRYLALIDGHTGNHSAAELKLNSLGLVRDWSIAGPFASDALDPQFGPEHGFRAGEEFTDRTGRQSKWRHIAARGTDVWTDLADFGPAKGTFYAATSLYSESPRTVALRFGSDSAMTVFFNGATIFGNSTQSFAAFDQHAIAVELHPGWNPIVLKLFHNGDGPSRFFLRTTAVEGGSIRLNNSATQDHQSFTKNQAPTAHTTPPPQDLVDLAQADASADPDSAVKLETLGLIELEHGRGTALTNLESAARLQPSADRWLEAAAACSDERCTFRALSSALVADATHERALLAIADYYLGRNQLSKTRDLLRRAIALAPDDFVARDRLAGLYTAAGLNEMALKQSRELQKEYPSPLWLKYRLAARYADLDLVQDSIALLRSELHDNFDDTTARTLLADNLHRTRDSAGLEALLTENLSLNPYDAGSLAQLASLMAGNGDFVAAERTTSQALDIADTPEIRQQYAELLSLRGNNAAASQQLVNVLARNPELDSVRRRLQLASSEADTSDADAPYLENAPRVASAVQRNAPSTNSNAMALSDTRIERVFDNGLSSVRVQQIYYIANDQGSRRYSSQSVQYAPATQQLRVLHARIYKPDGRIVEASDAGDSRVADASVSMYYDVRSREVQFPGVEKGDVVELDYIISPTTNINPYGNYFGSLVVFRTSVPEKVRRYVLITPTSRSFNIVEKRMPAPVAITEENGQRIYRWQTYDMAALPNESRAPSVTDIAPYVHVSTFATWDELGHWYAEMIRPQLALDSTLRDVASQIISSKHTDTDKINAIYQFVLRNTHYVALEFGIYSYKPYPVTQTYARRFGDCKDKASLMIALLRQAGIEADFALLRTRHMGEIDPRAASITLFDHAIVYLPKWDLWLDGTANYFSSRELPVEDQGAMALVVAADGSSQLRKVPITRPEDNYTRRVVRAILTPEGTIRFEGEAYTRGEDAPGLRRDLEVPERQRDSFRNSLAQLFPSVRVDDIRVHDGDDPEQAVNLDFRGTVDALSGRKVVPLATSWMQRSYVQKLAPLASRTQELILPAPWTTEEELHFQLPTGGQVMFMPANTALETQFGTARITYEKHGHEIVVKTSVQFRALRVAPGDYAAFREFCRSVERIFRSEVKVTLRG